MRFNSKELRMPTITLAICARNAQNIIGNCLDSIKSQSLPPDQILVAVDDLSDPTVDVAKRYGARVIASESTGLYEARNAVLEACTTDYLAFTDADCTLTRDWVKFAKAVLDTHEDVAAGTGRHPPVGPRNFAAWLHHNWFLVETKKTGETDGVIGGNSYFKSAALREVGGWLPLKRCSAAEDVYISEALKKAGHKIWFEEECAAFHSYETRLDGLWRKSVMMGRDIVIMLRAAGWYENLWYYTLAIPVLALMVLGGLLTLPLALATGSPYIPSLGLIVAPLALTFAYLYRSFGSLSMTVPRWVTRWIIIWPYSWGIVKGLIARIPDAARAHRKP
jgi:glycosyltransferase involved in cell wall biosynthesis